MANRMGGFRRGTRNKLKKSSRDSGKVSQRAFLHTFSEGEKVILLAEPAYQRGMYYPRYHGKVGSIKSKAGKCYNVEIDDHGKTKVLIVHPVHLRRQL